MIVQRFYELALMQVCCSIAYFQTHRAPVVDPRRDYQVYLDYAKSIRIADLGQYGLSPKHNLRTDRLFSLLVSCPDIVRALG